MIHATRRYVSYASREFEAGDSRFLSVVLLVLRVAGKICQHHSFTLMLPIPIASENVINSIFVHLHLHLPADVSFNKLVQLQNDHTRCPATDEQDISFWVSGDARSMWRLLSKIYCSVAHFFFVAEWWRST
jgi:hypothetical protein